jgi:selenocysteine-specific elongation factor
MKHVVVGTAGHIDHGKSALVKALTGTDPDRLQEEKERGITIDLGFAFLRGDDELSIGFVDVPGHERFVKNMLAGVGGIDLVMLVIAADESVMPQTKEHFEICRLLNIPRGIIVVTKSDLVDRELRDLAAMEARELVAGSFLESAPLVEVSSRTGEGLDELKETLVEAARAVPTRAAEGLFRLPVDRVFSMKGFGTVVTGTLVAGGISQDDEVVILPSGRKARVRGLQVHGRGCETASAGQRTAVNLQGVDVSQIERGNVLVRPGAFEPTHMIDAELEVLPTSPIPIQDLTRVHLHLGTAQVLARVRVLGGRQRIAPGESALVQLRLEAPIVAARFDRFILRRYSPLETIAGGVVMDAHPRKHSVASASVVERLEEIRGVPGLPPGGEGTTGDGERGSSNATARAVVMFASERGSACIGSVELARRLSLREEALRPITEALVSSGQLIRVSKSPEVFVAAEVVQALSSGIEEELRRFQKSHPLLEGMSKSELREKASGRASSELFEWLLTRLSEEKKVRIARDLVATADHEITMSADETRAREVLVERYLDAGYQPANVASIAEAVKLDAKLLNRVQRVLLKDGTLVQVADGVIFHRETLEKLKKTLRDYKEHSDRIDVGRFKERFGVTRKHAIPLLEWLDRERVTRRVGNERLIL